MSVYSSIEVYPSWFDEIEECEFADECEFANGDCFNAGKCLRRE